MFFQKINKLYEKINILLYYLFHLHTLSRIPSVVSLTTNCPVSLNSKIISIDLKIKYTPYGRHAGKDIAGLPKWSLLRYQYCPFAQKNNNFILKHSRKQ